MATHVVVDPLVVIRFSVY